MEGLLLESHPEPYRWETDHLNLKGKRLDPLRTEELKVMLKARRKGTFNLQPHLLFVDDEGKYRAYQPEPVEIVVRELGVAGWFKGPRR